ncbi:MotA/TolQ/ExbB proton channel family protein [Clostridium bornimense]|uniref:motility protein A n=1 Tax=Clostridium bornimense TaxID=1216932 RepID=UPI001C11F8B0|nr:MotA/TolQ/ExbB proton channel family protein [Clostridium bornimense]MBU5314762.1 MotA/TolQ/ExbB proton channel family protein [Clostridium bornimense]
MTKLDIMTPVGLILAVGLILYGILSGGTLASFIDVGSLAITVGGTFAAIFIAYPLSEVKKIPTFIALAMKEDVISKVDIIEMFSDFSKKARREGLLSLEDSMADVEDKFLKKGMQMVIDGVEPENIKDILELEIQKIEDRHIIGSSMFNKLATFAPGFGMIGTLIGLINMLVKLDDPSTISSGMATALITTLYGSLIANVLFLPIANKLNHKTEIEIEAKELMIEGILAVQSGVNPRIIEETLITYLPPKERELIANNSGDVDNG